MAKCPVDQIPFKKTVRGMPTFISNLVVPFVLVEPRRDLSNCQNGQVATLAVLAGLHSNSPGLGQSELDLDRY